MADKNLARPYKHHTTSVTPHPVGDVAHQKYTNKPVQKSPDPVRDPGSYSKPPPVTLEKAFYGMLYYSVSTYRASSWPLYLSNYVH